MRRFTRRGLLLGLMNLLFLVGSIGCSKIQSERADIDARANDAQEELNANNPPARGLAPDTAGVIVFPDLNQAGPIGRAHL